MRMNFRFLGSIPSATNFFFHSRSVRHIFGRIFKFAGERPTPEFSHERFDKWHAKRSHEDSGTRGRVILWDDTFVRYHEPHIGMAAVKVLEAAGFYVALAEKRKCCGRPAFSVGNLDEARKLGAHNLALLAEDDAPIIFLEPSCYSMFAEDYRELKLPGAADIAARCFLFEDFIENLLKQEPEALKFDHEHGRIAIHAHCHAKALTNTKHAVQLASRLPNRTVAMLDTGCCGMAGAFGMQASKYELSLKIAEPLIEQIKRQPYGATFVLSGTSCRHQVEHLASVRIKHMAEVLAEALV
jgi:Fe-S oxidoreductase